LNYREDGVVLGLLGSTKLLLIDQSAGKEYELEGVSRNSVDGIDLDAVCGTTNSAGTMVKS
jgi:hypothetical protein